MAISLHAQYIELLEAILQNSKNLRNSGKAIYSEMLRNKDIPIGVSAQFLFFSVVEECGKFFIVKDVYPSELSEKALRENGFYDHTEKWAKVMRRSAEITGDLSPLVKYRTSSKSAAGFIRSKVRETSLFVDYKKGKVMFPAYLSEKSLNKLIDTTISTVKLCEEELQEFKTRPILRSH